MRGRKRGGKRHGSGLAYAALSLFFIALICLAIFSAKCILLLIAAALTAVGVFLMRLG